VTGSSAASDNATDTFVYQDILEGGDDIFGFNSTAPDLGGDLINIADVLQGFSGTANEALGTFLNIEGANSNQDTAIQVDPNGGGNFQPLAILVGLGFTDMTENQLTDDNIIV
jgi:hypothetical protein